MTYNLYTLFRALTPAPRLTVGTVLFVADGTATVQLPDGSLTRARGAPAAGQMVYVRDGLIEGPAPNLPIEVIEV